MERSRDGVRVQHHPAGVAEGRSGVLSLGRALRARFSALLPQAPSVAILDDLFPHPISAFRYEEFCAYLDAIPDCVVGSSGASLPLVGEMRDPAMTINEHLARHPRHRGRVLRLRQGGLPRAEAYYALFINNIARHVPAIERAGKPFAFTLYPGGGFQLDDAQSDAKLERVLTSPCLSYVIVTQPLTRDYLLERRWCAPERIVHIQGNVVPAAAFTPPSRSHFGTDKATLDIGFIANRYTPRGEDKGYDLFVRVAEQLRQRGLAATYHVVGPWDDTIIPLGGLRDSVTFHGLLDTERLRSLAQGLDIVLAPNRPDRLAPGAFDGFPTGACVEAALQEAALVCTDVLNLNEVFVDGRELVIVQPEVGDIVDRLVPLIETPGAIASLGQNGRAAVARAYGAQQQLLPRIRRLEELSSATRAAARASTTGGMAREGQRAQMGPVATTARARPAAS